MLASVSRLVTFPCRQMPLPVTLALPSTASVSSTGAPPASPLRAMEWASRPRIRVPHWHGQIEEGRPFALGYRRISSFRRDEALRDGIPKRAIVGGVNGHAHDDRGQHDSTRQFSIPVVVRIIVKSVVLIIPSMMFWMHFFGSGLFAVSEEESEEESAINQRLVQFFDIRSKTEEEMNSEWDLKVAAVTDLSVRLLKSPNLAKVLRGAGFEANYILHSPPGELIEESPLWNGEWTPRLIFSSSTGVVICYVKFITGNNKWVPVEVRLVDAALSTVSPQSLWKMEGQLPHGVSFQRLPPKPIT